MTISKLIYTHEGGINLFNIITKTSEDEPAVDPELIAGLVNAIVCFSTEMSQEDEHIVSLYRTNINKYDYLELEGEGVKRYAIFGYNKYHIYEGVVRKVKHIYKEYIEPLSISVGQHLTDKELKGVIHNVLFDLPLKLYLSNNKESVDSILDPVLNDGYTTAYALTSSNNTILYSKGRDKSEIKRYLSLYDQDTIPQVLDFFFRKDLETGSDIKELKGNETVGYVTNTSINLPHEPWNEVLLYFFTRNHLMGLLVEDKSAKLFNSSHDWRKELNLKIKPE